MRKSNVGVDAVLIVEYGRRLGVRGQLRRGGRDLGGVILGAGGGDRFRGGIDPVREAGSGGRGFE